jgi:hypothetical protein
MIWLLSFFAIIVTLIPVLSFIEFRAIKKQGGSVLIVAKEKYRTGNIVIVLSYLVLVYFIIQPQEINLITACLKLYLIFAALILHNFLKDKIIFTNESIYMMRHFKQRSVTMVYKMDHTNLYYAEKIKKYDFKIRYQTKENVAMSIILNISKESERFLMKKQLREKCNLDLLLEEKDGVPFIASSTNYITAKQIGMLDKLSYFSKEKKSAIGMSIALSVALILKTSYSGETNLSAFFSTLIAIQYLPIGVYAMLCMFKIARGSVYVQADSAKSLLYTILLGGVILPFETLIFNQTTTSSNYLWFSLIGCSIITLIMACSWVVGKMNKRYRMKNMDQR